jgi:arylsulfatase A
MRFQRWAAIIVSALALSGVGKSADPARHEFTSNHMGTQFRYVTYGDKVVAESARAKADARVAELEAIFSDYKADSEIMTLCKANNREPNVPRAVSKDVVIVLKKALGLSKESDGAFDVTVGPLTQIWRITRRTQRLPDPKELAEAKAKVGYGKVTLDEVKGTVTLAVPGMRLDFGGIVKGYAADEALKIFASAGLKQTLIAASGDVRVGDAPPGQAGWEVEVADPEGGKALTVTLVNEAISTSGDLFQFVEIDGKRYSHILNPQTGLGLPGRRAVTVIAKSGIDADSLTKACSLLPADAAMKWLTTKDGTSVRIASHETDLSPVAVVASPRLKSQRESRKPNVVFILADDLGINDLGCYGRKDHHTPNLDRLASQGMRFTSAYCAQPICSPSRLAIMAGKHPAQLHLTTYLPGRADAPSQKLLHPKIATQLALEEKTLAEYLKEAGYATACIGKWHLGGPNFGPGKQGFENVYAGQANTKPSETEGGKGEYDLTRKACEFITANKDKPFFLYLPHNTPHIPLAAKPELIEKYKDSFNPVYAAMIHTMDETVGTILKTLDDLKLADNTIVVFTSDNGGLHVPELKDDAPTHNTPFRAGKGYLYEGGLRVPTIVRGPGMTKRVVSDVPFFNTDWLPTIVHACTGAIPKGPDSRSILNYLRGGPLAYEPLYWHFPHYNNQGGRPGGAIRDGNWKLIEHYDTNAAELYDLKADPGETNDLATKHPGVVRTMRNHLTLWKKSHRVQENTPNPNFDPARFKAIYEDFDSSKLKPTGNAKQTSEPWRAWRKRMDAAVSKDKKN